jgi:site-specific recombinase XerD
VCADSLRIRNSAPARWVAKKRNRNTAAAYASYQTGKNGWIPFLRRRGTRFQNATEVDISDYLIHLHEDKGLAGSTIDNAFSGVADFYRFNLRLPHRHQLVKDTLATIKNHSAPVQHKILPTDQELKRMWAHSDLRDIVECRDHFIRTIALKGALRGSETVSLRSALTSLELADGKRYLKLQFRNNADTHTKNKKDKTPLIAEETNPDNNYKCAVKAWLMYCLALHDAGIDRACSRYTVFNLTKIDLGKKLSDKHLNFCAKRARVRAGISSPFTGHSLRKWFASTAMRNQVPVHLIKLQGGWSSNAVFDYIEPSLEEQLSVSLSI